MCPRRTHYPCTVVPDTRQSLKSGQTRGQTWTSCALQNSLPTSLCVQRASGSLARALTHCRLGIPNRRTR